MPVGAGAAIATGLGLVGTAGGLTLAGGLVATGINAALFLGLTAASSALAQRELKKQGIAPRDVVVRGGDVPKVIVYGEAVVGAVMNYVNQRDVGNDDFELWVSLVHCYGESEAVLGVYYEDSYIDFSTDLNGSGDLTDTSSPWYAFSSGAGVYASRMFSYDGTQTTANTEFAAAFTDITSTFAARGYTTTLHRWYLWQGSEEIFKGGEPSNIRARIQGRKIYDPGLDTSPGANPDNALYIAWSHNPILCAVDYMRTYMGVAASRFDWTHIDAQATKAATNVTDPSGSVDKYSCNGALSLGDSHDDNLTKILATCLGFRTTVNGLIRFTVGDDQAADVTLDETDIIGQVTVRTAMPREERYNRVTGTYIAEDAGYTSTEFQPVEESAFVTRDKNETINKRLQLDMVTNEYQAQRVAYYLLQQSDQQITAEVPLRWSGLRLTPGTYVSVTYGKFNWSSKLFRCESIKIAERGVPVIAVLREDSASAWTDPASPGDYTTISPDGVVTKPAESVPPSTNLAANPLAQLGKSGILVTWTNPSESSTWDWVNVYASATSAWGAATLIQDRITDGDYFHDTGPDVTRYYWVRAVRNGIESLRDPNSDTSTITATAPPVTPLENLLPNKFSNFDFLQLTNIYTPASLWSLSTTRALFGIRSLYFAWTTNLGANQFQLTYGTLRNIQFQSLRRHIFTIWVYPETSDAVSANVSLGATLVLPGSETVDSTSAIAGTSLTQDAWQQIRIEFDTAAASPQIVGQSGYVQLEVTISSGTDVQFYFDNPGFYDVTGYTYITQGVD